MKKRAEEYKKALERIVELAIDPTAETQLDRIKRLGSVAKKALFVGEYDSQSKPEGEKLKKSEPTEKPPYQCPYNSNGHTNDKCIYPNCQCAWFA